MGLNKGSITESPREHHGNITPRGLRDALNWGITMPRQTWVSRMADGKIPTWECVTQLMHTINTYNYRITINILLQTINTYN